MPIQRVALIAVHGVADQRPNDTARMIADLLANLETDRGPAYGPFTEEAIDVPVRRIDVPKEYNARGIFSDRAPKLRARQALTMAEFDAGLEFMSSLLADYEVSGPEETYRTRMLHGSREGGVDVDVYEMYWADLSRLAANVFRIFGEIHQLLFHVGSLGVHVVAAAQAAETSVGGPWDRWSAAQRGAADCLAIYIPLFNLMLVGLALVLLPNALPDDYIGPAAWIGGGALVATLAGYGCFRARTRSWLVWLAPLVIAASAAAAAVAVRRPWWPVLDSHVHEALTTEAAVVAAGLLGVIIVLYDRHRPRAAEAGTIFGVLSGGFLLWSIWTSGGDMVTAVFHVIEAVYLGLVLAWSLFIALSWDAFEAGARVKRAARPTPSADRVSRAAWTARLTLALPAALFLILTIVLWDGLWMASEQLLAETWYEPSRLLLWIVPATVDDWTTNRFVTALIENGTSLGFGVLVAILGVGAALAAYAVAPIVVTEVFPYKRIVDGRRTGVWLDHGFRLLRQAGRLLCIGVLVVLPLGALIFVSSWLTGVAEGLLAWNHSILAHVGPLLVPAAAGLLVFGGRLRSLALGFRSIVDVLLDVDNYLREHPLTSTPRARICARFASLLRYVYARPYDAFVIVAHSQGTVIAADLLRFIKAANLDRTDAGLGARAGRPMSLFTMGSPLRQLYGLRFPHLYRWARHELADEWRDRGVRIPPSAVPDPAALDVREWVNAYRSGDYVGRHLWRPDRCAFAYETAGGRIAQPWRIDAYRDAIASVTDPPVTRREFCIGAGAHTHYWDRTAPQVAVEIDELIRAL